jgi:ATPase family associated with various cellular activities (AAA)
MAGATGLQASSRLVSSLVVTAIGSAQLPLGEPTDRLLRVESAFAGANMLERLIVVSGAPATGKTTVARLIASRLDRPLLSVDCEPSLAQRRALERLAENRHAIHRDVINPSLVDGIAVAAKTTQPLVLGSRLIRVDTGHPVDTEELVNQIAMSV